MARACAHRHLFQASDKRRGDRNITYYGYVKEVNNPKKKKKFNPRQQLLCLPPPTASCMLIQENPQPLQMSVCSLCKEKTAREQVMGANSAAVMHRGKRTKE